VIREDIASSVGKGAVIIDTGTTKVGPTRELAEVLAARGAHLIDAPVSGGPIGTAKGELYCFVGGRKDVAMAAWPLLRLLAKARLTYCGPSGAGQVVKGVNQLAMGLLNAAMVESVAYGVASGVDEAILLEAVGGKGGFRAAYEGVASMIAAGLGDSINFKYTEFDYFLEQADSVDFAAPIMRALREYLSPYPHDQIDNINRAHPSLWGALIGTKEPES
jgi:3-hydroxyisobutyrate dehydrogenase-like beta-hydroxyacid dehydrogenase